MSQRTLTDEPLRISTAFLDAPLASPFSRGVAFFIDLLICAIPSMAVAVGAAALALGLTDPQALGAVRSLMFGGSHLEEKARSEALKCILPLMVRYEAPGMPCALKEAVEAGKLDEAYTLLQEYDVEFNLQLGEFEKPPLKPKTIRIEVAEFIPRYLQFIAYYGVAATYFSLFTMGRRGATIGKRMAGLRVVRLDGHRLTLAEAMERFSGYLHIPASFGLSLLDLWRDPNRRMPHDRVVHTVVLKT